MKRPPAWVISLLALVVGLMTLGAAPPPAPAVTHTEPLYVAMAGAAPRVDVAAETAYGRWASRTIQVQDATDGGWRIAEAAAEWSAKGIVDLNVSRDACTGCIRVTEADNLGWGVGGLAHITTQGGIITGVWLELVRAYQYPHPVAGTVESHELGHALGLPHLATERAVMHAVARTSSPEAPAPPDWRALRENYRLAA